MQSKATNVDEYVASLPEDRREAISALRKVILQNLPKGSLLRKTTWRFMDSAFTWMRR